MSKLKILLNYCSFVLSLVFVVFSLFLATKIVKNPSKRTFLSKLCYPILVQPAAKEDGWDYEPFVLTKSEDGTKLYGRGSTDDKGPVCNIKTACNMAVSFSHSKIEGRHDLELIKLAQRI